MDNKRYMINLLTTEFDIAIFLYRDALRKYADILKKAHEIDAVLTEEEKEEVREAVDRDEQHSERSFYIRELGFSAEREEALKPFALSGTIKINLDDAAKKGFVSALKDALKQIEEDEGPLKTAVEEVIKGFEDDK